MIFYAKNEKNYANFMISMPGQGVHQLINHFLNKLLLLLLTTETSIVSIMVGEIFEIFWSQMARNALKLTTMVGENFEIF